MNPFTPTPYQLKFLNNNRLRKWIFDDSMTGKSTALAYELCCHLTKNYPNWWEGKRFTGPVRCIMVGISGLVIRDTFQRKMLDFLGGEDFGGAGQPGIPNAFDRMTFIDGSVIHFVSAEHPKELRGLWHFDIAAFDEVYPNDFMLKFSFDYGMAVGTPFGFMPNNQ